MVTVSELAQSRLPNNHSEPTVNRSPFLFRNRSRAERTGRDGAPLRFVQQAVTVADGSYEIVPTGFRAPVGGFVKRSFDVLVAGTTLILMAPIMGIIALLILLTMGRPIMFVQERVGFNRQMFGCFKFRTMVKDASDRLALCLARDPEAARAWAETQKLPNDPRVTWLGHILRKSSLDELPQLFNILRGDMSCIGPRPVLSEELKRYGVYARDYLKAKPGLTGMWQVNGRSATNYAHRVKCDRFYVRRWSVLLDMMILFKTIPAVMKHEETA
jgi:exopolysaccharide production protein ExoY